MEAEHLIQAIRAKTSDPALLDEDEHLPSVAVVESAIQFAVAVFALLDAPTPEPSVGVFFGEVNITWRSGTRMVRIVFFPDRPVVLVFGALSDPSPSYRSELNPSASEVAARLTALAPAL